MELEEAGDRRRTERDVDGAGDLDRGEAESEGMESGFETSRMGESEVSEVERASVRFSWMDIYAQQCLKLVTNPIRSLLRNDW